MSETNDSILLSVKNLSLTIGQKSILNKINFHIEKGKNLALVGTSGSGKSLTALSIMQLLPLNANINPASEINFKERDLLTLSEIELQKIRGFGISIIFQEPMTSLNPVMTIGQQINEVLCCHHLLKGAKLKQRSIELLTEVGIDAPEKRYFNYPHQLSGGMRQRVMIAMAIAAHPSLVIADEPTSALDVTTQVQILELLRSMQKKYGMTILFITHDLHIAKYIADKIAVIEKGEIKRIENKDNFIIQEEQYTPRKLKPENKLMLTTNKLCIYFPIQKGLLKHTVGYIKAVDGVSLNLYEHETLALVGESGSGKSTLAKGIAQLIKPYSGYIHVLGKNVTKLSRRELFELHYDIQIIFQDPFSSLNPRMVIADIIAEGLKVQGKIKSRQQEEAIVAELLELVGLPVDAMYRYPHEFSGGQRQRIVIARALAVKPKIIICDEPTSALDYASQQQIIDLLINLQNNFGLSYLFITHNMPLAAAIADNIAIMKNGEIIEEGKTADVLANPQKAYTRKLISSII